MYVRIVPSPALTEIDCYHHCSECFILLLLFLFGLCWVFVLDLWQAGVRFAVVRKRLVPGAPHCGAWLQQWWCRACVPLWHVGSSGTRKQTGVPCVARRTLSPWTSREAHYSELYSSASQVCHRRWRARRPSSVPVALCQLCSPLSLPQLPHL